MNFLWEFYLVIEGQRGIMFLYFVPLSMLYSPCFLLHNGLIAQDLPSAYCLLELGGYP